MKDHPILRLRFLWNDYLENYPRVTANLVVVRGALLRFPMRTIEFMLALLAIVTGFWIGWPWENVYKSDTYMYATLVEYMPAPAWTLLFLVPALPSTFFTGQTKKRTLCRIFGMGCLLSTWILASLLFIVDNSPHLATAWTPVFAFYQGWAMLNAWLRLDARETPVCPVCPNQSH